MEKLFSLGNTPEFIALLDNTVRALHSAGNATDFKKASMILSKFKEHPTMYRRVPFILEKTQLMQTRFIACQVMDIAITQRWKAMQDAEKGGIKNYLVNKIISLSRSEESLKQHRALISKMNHALVAILKFDWPAKWPTFVSEMVKSAKGNEILCENNVNILQLLGEEVFDFSRDQMTTAKAHAMKEQLKNEVGQIFELLIHVLRHSKRVSLILATLKTLQKFIPWIPLHFVFETDMMKLLVGRFFRVPQFQRDTLACLTEIVGLQSPLVQQKYLNQIRTLFVVTLTELSKFLPISTDIVRAVENGSEDRRMFVRGLSLFCTTYLSNHLTISEGTERPVGTVTCREATLLSMQYIVKISHVEDKEIFKICIEFWHGITKTLYDEKCRGGGGGGGDVAFGAATTLNGGSASSQRLEMYEKGNILDNLRLVMVTRMAKPEEVLIEQDERGEIVRQATKDTDAIAVYKTMRETIVYLTHLNYETTEDIMIDKLSKQVSGAEWSWNNLNRLCWAIGSISGTMTEESEKRFLVTVIKDLLGMCECKRGKDNKAVIASNIMYVVGQYPRFLRAHWRFLKTVVNKLFEFMHELHPGVQDMACDTFLKISKKCRREFVANQPNESKPYIEELLDSMSGIISELEIHQIYVFYEAVGFMISAEKSESRRNLLLRGAMSLPNTRWKALMHAASQNGGQSLKTLENVKSVSEVLRTNIAVCRALGYGYLPYLTTIYREMLNVCKLYSQHIKMCVGKFGRNALSEPIVRFMRVAKREALQLIELFIKKSKATHASFVAEMCLPPLLDPVLADYHSSIPMARDSHVLSLMATMVNKLKEHMTPHVPVVMESTFLVTFEMLKGNFTDFPDIRHAFFSLLKSIVTHCFPSIFKTPSECRMAVVSSILGAMQHTERIAAEMGLDILNQFLQHVQSDNNTAQMFYRMFFMNILRNVLVILTDRHHKSGFGKQAVVLKYMLGLVESGRIQVPLGEGQNNKQIVVNFMLNMISNLFPKMSKIEIQNFVKGSFDQSKSLNQFKQHLHDFLVHTKEWAGDRDNANMFLEEQNAMKKREMAMKSQVPGLIAPYELDDDDDI